MASSSNAVAHPLTRHISAPLPEILEVLHGRLPLEQTQTFSTFAQLLEAYIQCQFLSLRNSIKRSFLLFSRGALGKEYVSRRGRSVPSRQEFASKEVQFIADFMTLMESAHYQLVTKELWEIALKEDFLLTMPITVNMDSMDSKMLKRFWDGKSDQRNQLPETADRILIFYRGVSISRKTDIFISEKINLFLHYTVLKLIRKLFKKGVQEGEEESETPKLLQHEDVRVAERVTLRQLLPDWKVVLQKFLTKLEIVEPTFDDVVVLYRNAKSTLLSSTEKTVENKTQAKRNIVIKSFNSVPLADLEVIFPDKDVSLSNLSLVVLWVTLFLALITAGMTLWQTDIDSSVITSALVLLLGKLFQSYTSMQREKSTMMMNISRMLYDKTKDSQDGAVFSLLDDMADQQTKTHCIAYVMLLMCEHRRMKIENLDKRCVEFFEENFNLRVDFTIRDKLETLTASGLIKQNEHDEEMLSAISLEEANDLLTQKWKDAYKISGDSNSSRSFLTSGIGGKLLGGTLAGTSMVSNTISSTLEKASHLTTGLFKKRLIRKHE
eukprot:g2248.t1